MPGSPSVWSALADIVAPPAFDREAVYKKLNVFPHPRQRQFIDAEDWDVFYGGAMGGGKSVALLLIAFLACLDHPGTEVWMFRRTIPQLRGSLIKELREKFRLGKMYKAKWNDNERQLTFPNGSRIRFLYAESENDATDYYSQECQLLIVDERQLMNPSIVDQLSLRVRSGDPSLPVLGIRSAGNPGDVGHTVLRERYVAGVEPNVAVPIPDNSAGRCRRFIPARWTDNPSLNASYQANFDTIADPVLRAAVRDGNWDLFAGMTFAEWRPTLHVLKPFPVPAAWRRVAGIDYGFAAPWAVLWCAVDNDRRVWVYREIYQAEVGERRQAALLLEAERNAAETHLTRFADPSMWSRRGDEHPIAEVYALAGAALVPATNDRLAGVQRVHSYLGTMAPACPVHRAEGLVECPLLHVFSTCDNLIRTLPGLPRDPHRSEDVDTKADDHCFPAGTMVATPTGSRPIETVRPGDAVLTATGVGVVMAAGLTGTHRPISTVTLADGRTLTATPNHLIATQRGWITVDSLTRYDTVWTLSSFPPPCRATPEPGTTCAASTSSVTANDCTAGFGLTTTVRSQPASTSTTSTRTGPTTGWSTWNRSKRPPTPVGTVLAHPMLLARHVAATLLRPWPVTGTSLRHSDRLPRKLVGPGWNDSSWSVRSVAPKWKRRFLGAPGSAGSTAARQTCAVVGVGPAGTADVYNLTVLGHPSFYADTILTHNCYDALRYALMSLSQPFVPRPRHRAVPEQLRTNTEIMAWQAVQDLSRRPRRDRVVDPFLGRL